MQIRETVISWLDTFSPVETLAHNPDALAKELETIVGVFSREGAGAGVVESVFRHIKMTSQSRAWPTAAQVYEALRFVMRETPGEVKAGSQGGDREKLTGMELTILETKILPSARRWLRESPGLRGHAISTLQHWGEPLIDDRGVDWTKRIEKAVN